MVSTAKTNAQKRAEVKAGMIAQTLTHNKREEEEGVNLVIEKLMEAAKTGNIEVVEECLTSDDITVNITDSRGKTAFYHACSGGQLDVVKLLHKKGANIDHRAINPKAWTPLHVAASNGHAPVFAWLLEIGANKNALTADRKTVAKICEDGKKFYKGKRRETKGHVVILALLEKRAETK